MRELIDGSTAIARGALVAGCNFFAGYPITPASPILMTMMRELPKTGGVAIQGEDEIASIGMCIGATLAGARAMTASSGPGMSLYSESIGLAVIGEVPLVIVDVQRMGPATGGATTVAQGDVQFVRWGTSGGYPVIVLAPSSIAECFQLTVRAFELAERFRCPVFLLTDKELNLTLGTVEADAFRRRVPEPAAGSPIPSSRPYRYEPPEDVTPLPRYGGDATLRFTGSSHDECAFITKKPSTVGALNRHLAAKIDAHQDEIEDVVADLEAGATTLLVAYGTTAGAMREAVSRRRREGGAVSALTLKSLWPVPERALAAAVPGAERIVVGELNPGLYRREVERVAAKSPAANGRRPEVVGVNRLDGELISPEDFLEAMR